jgi:hypothetical protein
MLAAGALVMLSLESLREVPWTLLFLVMAVKLTYGPLATCISLLKLEAFPTEVRASTFALVSMMGKLLALVAPTAAEVMRCGPSAEDWTNTNLLGYMWCLVGACALTGAFGMLVDRGVEENAPLEDTGAYEEQHEVVGSPMSVASKVSRAESGYGSFFDIWAPRSPKTPTNPSGAFGSWMLGIPDSPMSSPSRGRFAAAGPESPSTPGRMRFAEMSPKTPGGTPLIIHS